MKSLIPILFAFALFSSCDDPQQESETNPDEFLQQIESSTENYVWFGNSDAFLNRSTESGHPETQLRTRYNTKAAEKLTAVGFVESGAVFENGSLIVKELIEDGGINTIAIMYKDVSNEFADEDGWMWGYFDADGGVRESAIKKGAGCRGCHLQTGHIDLTLMNKAFTP